MSTQPIGSGERWVTQSKTAGAPRLIVFLHDVTEVFYKAYDLVTASL